MKEKVSFVCSECGYRTAKWLGKCPGCGEWNTLEEQVIVEETGRAKSKNISPSEIEVESFDDMTLPEYMRQSTGLSELDRVLGGGLVHGSVVLVAGEPGVGKSTMLMQVSAEVSKKAKILYVSGEESKWQLKYRAKRLGIKGDSLFIMTETNIDKIFAAIEKTAPEFVIIDSIQTIYDERLPSAAGSIVQVRECSARILNKAKGEGITVILVGHVNKEGGIAGPKVLEHMVDAVVYFEGERQYLYRVVRAVKNRYGPTNEIGVFSMTDKGLQSVENPSEMLLSGRPTGVSGNCAVCVLEGTRPIIAEIQALATPTFFPSPKRTSSGIDYNRMCLLLAVLEKRLGLKFSTCDIYLNVVGGLRIDEPASDLAVVLALISSIKDRPIADNIIAMGEVGLAGECRAVNGIDIRIKEAIRLGFNKIIIPETKETQKINCKGAEIINIKSIYDLLKVF